MVPADRGFTAAACALDGVEGMVLGGWVRAVAAVEGAVWDEFVEVDTGRRGSVSVVKLLGMAFAKPVESGTGGGVPTSWGRGGFARLGGGGFAQDHVKSVEKAAAFLL